MDQQLSPAAIDEISRLLEYGNVIQAIKVYRVATGCGLKDAKDGVEALQIRFHEIDPQRFAPVSKSRTSGPNSTLIVGTLAVVSMLIAICLFLLF